MTGINLKVIPHDQQRYPTAGDYWYARDNTWEIRISRMEDWRYEFLVGFHEILEMAWCHYTGVSLVEVDAFDVEFEKNRKDGDLSEPGNDPGAPYYFGHQIATIVERIAAVTLGVQWEAYNDALDKL